MAFEDQDSRIFGSPYEGGLDPASGDAHLKKIIAVIGLETFSGSPGFSLVGRKEREGAAVAGS